MFNSNSISMSHTARGLILALCTLVAIIVSAGAAALAQAAPVATDWTTISGNKASGTLAGTTVDLEGTQIWNTPTSRLDGSWPAFASASTFSPALPTSDVIQIAGAPSASYTIRFGGAGVKDPILHLGSLASRINFSVPVTQLSSEGGFTAGGNSATGNPGPIGASGNSDASGSIRLTGTVTTVTFTTTPNYAGPADGILVQIVADGSTPPPPPPPACANADMPITHANLAAAEEAIVCLTNLERTAAQKPPLTVDARLRGAARAHSQDMVQRAFYDHVNKDNKTPCDRILAAGYPTKCYVQGTTNTCWTGRCNENIHRLWASTPRQAVRDWMASAGHKAAILTEQFKHIGVGLAPGDPFGQTAYPGAPAVTATQKFGSPV